MIGFYDYTVVLTYIGFASGVTGIFCASTKHLRWAVFFLALSGLCDMFDGKVARTKKNRTEEEKSFGIQIDSLCDIVCFGILPVVICFHLGMRKIYSMAVLILYGLAGVIRLAYFNVMETKRQESTNENRKYYQGLPITSMAVALPLLFVFSPLLPNHQTFLLVLHFLEIIRERIVFAGSSCCGSCGSYFVPVAYMVGVSAFLRPSSHPIIYEGNVLQGLL